MRAAGRDRVRLGIVAAAGASLAAGGAAGVVAIGPAPAAAATLAVTSTADGGPGSLRQALADATDDDVVDLSGVSGTIALTSGPLVLDHHLTISGPGAEALTVSAGHASRVFEWDPTVGGTGTVELRGFTVADGEAPASPARGGGGILFACGLNSATSLVLDHMALTGNHSVYLGGGLYFDECNSGGEYGSLTITASVVSGNASYYSGAGGVWFDAGRDLTVTDTVISGNFSVGWAAAGIDVGTGRTATISGSRIVGNVNYYDQGGGASFRSIDATVTGTTIADNVTTQAGGAGIAVFGNYLRTFTLRDSTVAGNVAEFYGGGLYVAGAASAVVVENSTISGNSAGQAGAVYGGVDGLRLVQSTVTANAARNASADAAVGGILLSGPAPSSPCGADAGHRAQTRPNGRSGAVVDRQRATTASACAPVAPDALGVLELVGTIVAGNVGADVGRWKDRTVSARSDHSVLGVVEPAVPLTDLGGTRSGVVDPRLGPLADNGGPTRTHALLPDSPALDAGPVPVPTFPENATDQRGPGFARVVNGVVDVGAFEVQPVEPTFTG